MMTHETEIQESLRYLNSDQAQQSLEADPYWPKWNAPWWHMLLLHEMGRTQLIPEKIIHSCVASLNRYPVKTFPLTSEDLPPGVDLYRTPCHCQLGTVYQVFAAWGLDVDQELPWIRPWLLRYQMADGGLNCDGEAYLVKHECPSSMVGTISVFEAVLLYTPRPWTPEEKNFLDKAAQFLIVRKLMRGSPTQYNAAERISAEKWLQPCFPRLYFYDVLRGLNAILLWSEKTQQFLPPMPLRDVILHLKERFPDDKIRIERQAYTGIGTLQVSAAGTWERQPNASFFPLLKALSKIGEVSPYLSKQWLEVKERILRQQELKNLL